MYKRVTVAVILFWSTLILAACSSAPTRPAIQDAVPLTPASAPVYVAEWQDVADTEQGKLRVDKASVTREGKFTKAVLVYEFKKEQRFTAPPKDVFTKREDNVLVDCTHPSLGLQASRFFDKEKLVNSYTEQLDHIKFSPAAPDTMTKTVVDAVCALAPTTKP